MLSSAFAVCKCRVACSELRLKRATLLGSFFNLEREKGRNGERQTVKQTDKNEETDIQAEDTDRGET